MVNFGLVLIKHYKLGLTDVDRQINIVIITLVLLIYISSGMVVHVENVILKNSVDYDPEDLLTFNKSFYFVVVTLLTVGYGDYYPETELGKFIVIFIVIFTIVIVPKQTNDLLALMSL